MVFLGSRSCCVGVFVVLVVVAAYVQGVVDEGIDDDDIDSEDTDSEYTEDDFEDDDAEHSPITNGTIQFVRDLKNVSRNAGATIRFRCEVKVIDPATPSPISEAGFSNSAPTAVTPQKITIKWRQHAAHLPIDKRFRQKTFSKPDGITVGWLRIADLEAFDRGWYYCTAARGVEKITSKGFLEVKDKFAGNADLSTYKPLSNGVPGRRIGDLTTYLPSVDSREESDFLSTITNGNLPRLSEQTVNNPDLFEHVGGVGAGGGGGGGGGEGRGRGALASQQPPQPPPPAYNAHQPFCQMYTGQMCKQFMEDEHIFVQPPYTQQQIEDNLHNSLIVISQSNEISTGCNKFVLPIMCFSAFPLCRDPEHTNSYQKYYINKYNVLKNTTLKLLRTMTNLKLQRICKQDCILLETEVCSKEYSIAKRHPVLGRMLELEECKDLPEEDDKDNVRCLKLGVERAQNVDKDDKCYWDSGQLYRGTVDVSVTNARCMRWSHQVHFPLSDHPELIGHNYCRNPGGEMLEPYCYVEHNKREVCGLGRCANIIWTYIGGIGFIFLTLAFLALFMYCCKRNHKQPRGLRNMSIPTADKNIYGNGSPTAPPIELNSLLPPNIPPARGQHSKNGFQNVPQYSLKEVAFVEELGEGAFGKVYKGELRTKSSGRIFVAVKSLKENASAKTQADFQREIELISELKHPNIICLLGVVMKQEPMCMLFEYMSEGDLHEFLIGNSPNEGKALTQLQFLHISIQIAQGMEYLSENHYVHRDLAARNCLVSKDLVVKISDFGLSRDMYSCDYYRVQSKSLLPVRWMPPESILYGKFTTESDVWSYGVVLWEIYSYGLQPYYGYNNQEVINMIRSRKLLPCPEACPSYCYALMVECWAELAIRRPSFGEISHRLRVWKQNGNAPTSAYFKSDASSSGVCMGNGGGGGGSSSGGGGKYNTAGRSTNGGGSTHTHSSSHSGSAHTMPSQSHAHAHHHHHAHSVAPPADGTWERAAIKRTSGSQSSLTSKSSLGNRTQSTNLSDQQQRNSGSRRSHHRGSSRNCDTNSLERLNPIRAHSVNSAL